MANCNSCSAPLPHDSLQCEYCGTLNDIDLSGVHRYTTHEPESSRLCPRCNVALRTIDLNVEGRFLIERCDSCLGLFFDPNELEALLDATVRNVFTVNRSELGAVIGSSGSFDHGVTYLKCPVCSQIMSRVNFGARSGVVVDRCKEHGVWLDAGELRQLFNWTKAGGRILDQERREQRKNEEASQEKERSRPVTGGDVTFDHHGTTITIDDHDIFYMLRSAIEFLLR